MVLYKLIFVKGRCNLCKRCPGQAPGCGPPASGSQGNQSTGDGDSSLCSELATLWQVSTPQTPGCKQASANIFQDAELVQIQGLFQRSGDQLAEERAQIIWECAGDYRVAEALRRLRRERPPRQNHCRQHWLRVLEPGSTVADPQASTPASSLGNSWRTSARAHQNWNKPGPPGSLHQIRH